MGFVLLTLIIPAGASFCDYPMMDWRGTPRRFASLSSWWIILQSLREQLDGKFAFTRPSAPGSLKRGNGGYPPYFQLYLKEKRCRKRQGGSMRKVRLSMPELALIAGTRGALGAGIALLLADRLTSEQRKAAGTALALVGIISTVPLLVEVLANRE
jgi:hypothetical protein